MFPHHPHVSETVFFFSLAKHGSDDEWWFQDPWVNGDGMWAVREAFVAICTTNMPPVVPLLRVWLSPCLGRTESVSDGDDDGTQTTRRSKYSHVAKRSASRASRKSQVLHNKTMSERYFADFETPAPPARVGTGEDEIKLQTYATSRGSDASTVGRAQDMPPHAGMEKSSVSTGTRQKQDVDDNVVQTAREIV